MTPDYKNDHGIPDWREPLAYPDEERLLGLWREQGFFPGEATLLSMWRWEFLRRREDYRDAWCSQYDASQAHWDEVASAEGVLSPLEKRSDFNELGARHLSGMAKAFSLELIFAPSWQFRITSPGLFKSSFGFGYSAHMARDTDSWGRHKIEARLETEDQMLIGFDLSLPLAEQLRRAQLHLEAVQAERSGGLIKPPRHHRRLWPKYLRALDAREAGETFESIWENLELEGVSVEEFDARADAQNWAASGQQLWKQANDLMFKLTS